MTKTNHANPKRAYETSTVTIPAAQLRPAARRARNDAKPAAVNDAVSAADLDGRSPDLKPALILRLIDILKDL